MAWAIREFHCPIYGLPFEVAIVCASVGNVIICHHNNAFPKTSRQWNAIKEFWTGTNHVSFWVSSLVMGLSTPWKLKSNERASELPVFLFSHIYWIRTLPNFITLCLAFLHLRILFVVLWKCREVVSFTCKEITLLPGNPNFPKLDCCFASGILISIIIVLFT